LVIGFWQSFAMRYSVLWLAFGIAAHAFASSDQNSIAVEALLRLNPQQVEQSPKLKETVSKLLARTRGTQDSFAWFSISIFRAKVPGSWKSRCKIPRRILEQKR